MQLNRLLESVIDVAEAAGREILAVYRRPCETRDKSDGTPVTLADRRAHRLIDARLAALTPDVPVLSEESPDAVKNARRDWSRLWLVDPLDGTRQFIDNNDEFTVNVALIEDGEPVLGVVHAPVAGVSHFAVRGGGAARREDGATTPIGSRKLDAARVTVVASRSHAGALVDRYRDAMRRDFKHVDSVSMGSALKTCLVAEGRADVYPRLGPTSEWDTAAAHCVLNEAGGRMLSVDGAELVYNKPDTLLNPWFLAFGDPDHDWFGYLD